MVESKEPNPKSILWTARGEFDLLGNRQSRRVAATHATTSEIPMLVSLAGQAIPALAAAEPAVRRVHARDPETIWTFRFRGEVAGLFALLYLNHVGLQALIETTIDCADPSNDLLCDVGEPVQAIYVWALVAPGIVAEGIQTASRQLQGPRYCRANLYSRPVGAAAERINRHYGFRPIGPAAPLLRYVRLTNRVLFQAA